MWTIRLVQRITLHYPHHNDAWNRVHATRTGAMRPTLAAAAPRTRQPRRSSARRRQRLPPRARRRRTRPRSLGWLLEIAPIYLVATAILAGDALGVCRFAAPLWLAAMLAIVAAALFMRRAALAATAVAMVAIAAAVSMPARDAVAPPFSAHSIRNFSDGAAVTLEGRINRASQQYPDREYVFVDVDRAGAAASSLRSFKRHGSPDGCGRHAHGARRRRGAGGRRAALCAQLRRSRRVRLRWDTWRARESPRRWC